MYFTQKIYYHDKPIVLTDNAPAFIREHPEATGFAYTSGATEEGYREALRELEKPGARGVLVVGSSPPLMQSLFRKVFKEVAAGGGIVRNEDGGVLMIYRRGHWDLPKGKQDEGEDIASCALREVREETGLSRLRLGAKTGESRHIYREAGRYLLKHTTWFMMCAEGAETLTPQAEEDILEARWAAPEELRLLTALTYETIREALRDAGLLDGN